MKTIFIIVSAIPMIIPSGPAAALLSSALLLAPAASAAEATRARQLMGTRCVATVIAVDEAGAAKAAAAALDAIAAVEDRLSTWRPDSELSRANAAGEARLSPALASALAAALELARATGGAFDPTVGPLVEAWDLRGAGRIPGARALEQARTLTGHERVRLDGLELRLPPGGWIDPGAFGKGLALDAAVAALREAGVDAALIDFGGQLAALGAPPGESGWRLGLADPRDRGRSVATVRVRDAFVSTSAQAERGRLVDGRLLGHVLDPRTGRPAERRGGATVVAPTGIAADAWSTALLVLGPEALTSLPHAALWLEPEEPRLALHSNPAGASLVLDTHAALRLEIHR